MLSQNINLSQYMKSIKKPSLNMLFIKYKNNKPNIDSHLGGRPYFTKDDVWPVCPHCQSQMNFFMQLRELTIEGKIVLRTFFQCPCKIENYEPIIRILEYFSPQLEHCITVKNKTKISPFVEIKLEPSWSIPNWSLLPVYDLDLYNQILSMYNNDAEAAEDYYDTLRWNENYLATEPYSLIAGYPEFISDPKLSKCNCCKKETDFVFQLDTDEDFQLDWNGGVLYCFQCPTTKTFYFTIN